MASALQDLVTKISGQVQSVSKLLDTSSLPPPTFAESGAETVGQSTGLSAEDELALVKARNDLVNSATDLLHLAQGPVDHMVNLAYASADTANLNTVVRFQVPQKVPFGSTISFPDLAKATGLPEDTLIRTVRYAITNGVFEEPQAGQVGHSAASATLAKNKNLHDMTVFNSGFSTRIICSLADALKAQHDKVENPPEAAFNVSYPGYANLFDYMGKHPDASQEYFSYLDGRSQLSRYSVDKVVSSWNWDSVATGTIIDVGGSSGHTAIAVARHLPKAKVIVQDINGAGLEMGRKIIEDDTDLKSRMDFQEYDFFKPQPVEADVYFFRHVLHDWPDAECVKIIQSLLPALKDGARVLVSEGVMPEPPAQRTALLDDRHVRIDDHVMLAAHVAKERSVEQYAKLFETADGGFSLVGVTGKGAGVHHTMVEFKFNKK